MSPAAGSHSPARGLASITMACCQRSSFSCTAPTAAYMRISIEVFPVYVYRALYSAYNASIGGAQGPQGRRWDATAGGSRLPPGKVQRALNAAAHWPAQQPAVHVTGEMNRPTTDRRRRPPTAALLPFSLPSPVVANQQLRSLVSEQS